MAKKNDEAVAGVESMVGKVDAEAVENAAALLQILGIDVSNLRVQDNTPLVADDVAIAAEQSGTRKGSYITAYGLAIKKAKQTGVAYAHLVALSCGKGGGYIVRDASKAITGFGNAYNNGYRKTDYKAVVGAEPCQCPSNRDLGFLRVVMTNDRDTVKALNNGWLDESRVNVEIEHAGMVCFHTEARDMLIEDFGGKLPSPQDLYTALQIHAAKLVPWMRGFKSTWKFRGPDDDVLQKFCLEAFEDRRRALFGEIEAERQAEAEKAKAAAVAEVEVQKAKDLLWEKYQAGEAQVKRPSLIKRFAAGFKAVNS